MGPGLELALFDTTVPIDVLNGVAQASREIRRYERRLISIVTWIEVLVGCRTEVDRALADALLESFEVVPLTDSIAERTILVRQQTRLKLPDAVILASAQERGCVLVTRNTKDFDAADPGILVPYQV